MLTTNLLAALLPLALAAPAPDEKKVVLPASPPPRVGCVAALDPAAGEITLHEVSQQVVPELRTELRTINGKKVEVQVTVYQAVLVQQQRKLSLKEGKAFDTSGTSLEPEEVWKRLKIGTAVLISADGNKVDPAYLGIIAKEAVILAIPAGTDAAVPQPAKISPP
jgi:hypothetical protein